jgi:hypothetical protein
MKETIPKPAVLPIGKLLIGLWAICCMFMLLLMLLELLSEKNITSTHLILATGITASLFQFGMSSPWEPQSTPRKIHFPILFTALLLIAICISSLFEFSFLQNPTWAWSILGLNSVCVALVLKNVFRPIQK